MKLLLVSLQRQFYSYQNEIRHIKCFKKKKNIKINIFCITYPAHLATAQNACRFAN